MYLKTFVLLAAFATTPLSWADEDPYLWLEGVDDESALDWVRAQNKSTAERLKSSPLFEGLYAQAKAVLNSSSRIPGVYQQEGWLYNFWRDENNPRGVFRRTTLAEFAKDEPACLRDQLTGQVHLVRPCDTRDEGSESVLRLGFWLEICFTRLFG